MILYDLTAIQSQGNVKFHGGGLYANLILKRMLERNLEFEAFWDSRRYISPSILEQLKHRKIKIYDLALRPFEEIVDKIHNPLVFSILPKEYMFIVPTVGTIHDCREIELENDFWEFRYRIPFKRKIIKIIKYIFAPYFRHKSIIHFKKILLHPNFLPTTITQYTLERIKYWIKEAPDMPIFMTPFSEDNEKAEYIPYSSNKYFLMVSGDRWLKNNLRAIAALDQLFSNGELKDFKVKITGIESFDHFSLKIKNKENFELLGYIDSSQLTNLYKYAYCFIFPSLYEGFGIPPLEAMKFGTPVLASNTSAIPEVCADSVLYFEPKSISDIRDCIRKVINTNIYQKISKSGVKRYTHLKKTADVDIDKYLDLIIYYAKNLSK